jgi:hypothetical protein
LSNVQGRLVGKREWLAHPYLQAALDDGNPPFYTWFADGALNASYNCLDRYVGAPHNVVFGGFALLLAARTPPG